MNAILQSHGETLLLRIKTLPVLLEDKNNEGFLQKTCWYSLVQSGQFWRLDSCISLNFQ